LPEEWLLYHNPFLFDGSTVSDLAVANIIETMMLRTGLEHRLNMKSFYADSKNLLKMQQAAVINNKLL